MTCLPSSPRSCGHGRRGGDLPGREPVELGHVVDDQGQLVGVGEQRLLELGLQRGELSVELLQLLLVVVGETGAGQGELRVVALDQVLLLGLERGPVVVHGLDALRRARS